MTKHKSMGMDLFAAFAACLVFAQTAQGEGVVAVEGREASQVEEFVLITTEAKWYRNNRMTGKGVPELEAAAAACDDFVVDYVRVYDIVD